MPTSKTKTTTKASGKTGKKNQKPTSAAKSTSQKSAKAASRKSTTKKSTMKDIKKTTVKKSLGNNKAANKSPNKNSNNTMTKKRVALIADIKVRLEEQRINLLQGLHQKEHETEVSSHGDLIDQSQNFSEHEVMLGLAEHDRNLLQEINVALDKIDQGKYGICEMSGELISDERLIAMPTARYSMECQAKIESFN